MGSREEWGLIAVPRPWVGERTWSWFSAVSGAWPLPWLVVRQPLKWIFTMKPPENLAAIERDRIRQMALDVAQDIWNAGNHADLYIQGQVEALRNLAATLED